MEFEDAGNPDAIKEKIIEYFTDKWQMGEKIQYTNAAYDIGEFYKLSTKFNELN